MNPAKTILWAVALLAALSGSAAPRELFRSSFNEFSDQLPNGWSRYGAADVGSIVPVSLPDGGQGTLLDVKDAKRGLGLQKRFPAAAGKYYRATLDSSALPGRSQKGAYLQLRFYPYPLKTFGNSEYLRQVPLADSDARSNQTEVSLAAPAGTTHITAFIITGGAAPALRLRDFRLEESDAPFAAQNPGQVKQVFESDFADFGNQLPTGWNRYGAEDIGAIAPLVLPGGRQGALLDVKDAKRGMGLHKQFSAAGGRYYRATLDSSALPGRSQAGAYLQLRFYPYPLKTFGNSEYLQQVPLEDYDEASNLTEVSLVAPAGTTKVTVYIVTAGAAPAVRLRHFRLEESDAPFVSREPDPQKVPGALKDFSRDLRLDTILVKNGRPAAVIVAPDSPEYRELAAAVNRAVKAKTGTELQVVKDDAFAQAEKLEFNAITLGSRDVNRSVGNLYNRFYTILDGRYPGQGGAVVRSVHDPFGHGGGNVITVGGSDPAGDRLAVEKFIRILDAQAAGPELKLGYLADITLGKGLIPPADARDVKTWDYSRSTGEKDHFGWTLLSKNLALFYLTGDEKYAREFLRFAFPDDQAAKELTEYESGFAIANVRNPLAEPYHYNSSMLVLHWDLVEEHPFFSGEIRTRVIEKLYEQLNRRRLDGDKGIYKIFNVKEPQVKLNDRHYLAEALTVFIVGRYFDKYYPSRDGRDALAAAKRQMATLDQYPAIVAGSLFWYNTFLRPAFDYALIEGGMKYVGSPVIDSYVEALTLLADRTPADWSQELSSIRLLNQMAYMTGNQAPVEIVRLQENFDPDVFRIGQSFWPAKAYPRNYFSDTDGKWRIAQFDPRGMLDWNPPFEKEKVVEWMSYRRHGEDGNDFLLLDAKYESGRNPFHNFALISLYLRDIPLLRGYHNQLHIYRDGLGDPAISNFTEILQSGRAGKTAYLRGKHARFNGHAWERVFLVRENRFLLEIDTVTPLDNYQTSQIIVNFETPAGSQAVPVPAVNEFEIKPKTGESWTFACSRPAVTGQNAVAGGAHLHTSGVNSQFAILEPGRRDEAIRFASVLRPGRPAELPSAAQLDNVVAFQLPEPAALEFAADGSFELEEGDHRFGFNVRELAGLFTTDQPVVADYDAAAEILAVVAQRKTVITLADNRRQELEPGTETRFELKPSDREDISAWVAAIAAAKPKLAAAAADLPVLAKHNQEKLGSFVSVHEKIELDGKPHLLVAVDDRALILDYAGRIKQEYRSSALVGAVYYWSDRRQVLVGSIDEKLRAFALDGRQLWEFTSQMPDGIQHDKMWWAKGEMPGVCRITVAELEPGQPLIFVGGAGTLEILDPAGRLLKRQFQEWGTFEGFTLIPAHGQVPSALISWGFMVGHPTTYRYTADLKRGYFELGKAKDGSFMGGFGFGFVGRNHLLCGKLTPNGPELLIGDFNGTVNRLMIWDLAGKVLREADLGFGIRAFGGIPYAKTMLRNTNVRGLELPDFDGSGHKSIAVAFQRKFVSAFDAELKSRFFCPLPANPLSLTVVPGSAGDRLAVGCADGKIYLIDGTGRITAQAGVSGRPTLLASDGATLAVGTEAGEFISFQLP